MRKRKGPHFRALVFLGLPTLGVAVGVAVQTPSERPLIARVEPGNKVTLIDPASGRGREVYRSGQWSTRDLSVSPDGRLLAFLEWEAGVVVGTGYQVPPKSELIVIDTLGKVVARVARNVQRYVWCGPTCLAYLNGQYAETHYGFTPDGLFIYDLTDRSTKEVPGLEAPVALHYASFDTALYIRSAGSQTGRPILRFSLGLRTLQETSHLDFDFSPSGQFYLHTPDGGDGTPKIFDSRRDAEVLLPEARGLGVPVRWAPTGAAHVVLARPIGPAAHDGLPPNFRGLRPIQSREAEYTIFDVQLRRKVQVLRGRLPDWSTSPNVLTILSPNGKVHAISRP